MGKNLIIFAIVGFIVLLALWILTGWMINSFSNNYIKCRQAHKPVDVCVIGS